MQTDEKFKLYGASIMMQVHAYLIWTISSAAKATGRHNVIIALPWIATRGVRSRMCNRHPTHQHRLPFQSSLPPYPCGSWLGRIFFKMYGIHFAFWVPKTSNLSRTFPMKGFAMWIKCILLILHGFVKRFINFLNGGKLMPGKFHTSGISIVGQAEPIPVNNKSHTLSSIGFSVSGHSM